MYKMLFLILTLCGLLNSNAYAQSQCDELRQEEKVLEKRLREIRKELEKCNSASNSDCTEQTQNIDPLEIKSQCAEIKGNIVTIHFTIKNTVNNPPARKLLFYNYRNVFYDQNGNPYNGRRIKIGNKAIGSTETDNFDYVDCVYNIVYPCSVEFYISNNDVKQVRLFELHLFNNDQKLIFENIDLK